MVAIGFGDLQDLQVPREQRAIKVTLALQVQQGRSAQQAQQVPKDPLDLGDPRGLLEILPKVSPPALAASSNVQASFGHSIG